MSAERAGIWSVLWKCNGVVCLMDFDDEIQAARLGIMLAELGGREDVMLSGPQLVDVDVETRERIRERVLRAAKTIHVEQLMREAAG